MIKEAIGQIKTALTLLIVFTVLTGLLYPLAVTGLAQLFFPAEANGSLIKQEDTIVGSSLIGQSFSSPAYFWGRPSATTPYPFNGGASSGSNLGPTNPSLLLRVKERISQLKQANSQNNRLIPVDLVTSSASGLDPDISPRAALYQMSRIAKVRKISEERVNTLIQNHIKNRLLGFLGEPRVNVLGLNLALDKLRTNYDQTTPKP